jgi:hypothetical protein
MTFGASIAAADEAATKSAALSRVTSFFIFLFWVAEDFLIPRFSSASKARRPSHHLGKVTSGPTT